MLKFDMQRDAYHDFADLLDTDLYQSLPDDWLIGITDVIDLPCAFSTSTCRNFLTISSALCLFGAISMSFFGS